MSRRLTSPAMRFLEIWCENVRGFDRVLPGSVEERHIYAAVNIALPPSLRWRWQALADELGCNVRTLRRDARRPEVRALADAGRLRVQGVCAMLALRTGISKVAAAAARGEPEAVVALAQIAVALGLEERVLEPLHAPRAGGECLVTPGAMEALAEALPELGEGALLGAANHSLEPRSAGGEIVGTPSAGDTLASELSAEGNADQFDDEEALRALNEMLRACRAPAAGEAEEAQSAGADVAGYPPWPPRRLP